MKKLVLFFAAVVAVAFASCGAKEEAPAEEVAPAVEEVAPVVEEVVADTTVAAPAAEAPVK